MRELIENEHRGDALVCWTWHYLAKQYGADLTKGNYRAIHEDGSSYDDDVGGPLFVVGQDGVELPEASDEIKAQAKARAEALFNEYVNE